MIEALLALGVRTVIAIGRIPRDRGEQYTALARTIFERLLVGEERRAWYDQLGLRFRVAGDPGELAHALDAPSMPAQIAEVHAATEQHGRATLIHLPRIAPGDAAEEAQWGYRLGCQLGRAPTGDELIRAFYGVPVPPLDVYVGSGRPRVGFLRPPFISGQEDLYWSAVSPIRLDGSDWRRIMADHQARLTRSNREYAPEDAAAIAQVIRAYDHEIVGLGQQHPLGFWMPSSRGSS